MKRFIIMIICSIVSVAAFSQINSYTIQKRKAIVTYDSLKNVPDYDKIKSLIGQTIMFPEDEYIKKLGGFKQTFYSCPTFSSTIRTKEREVYSPLPSNPLITKSTAIADRKFKIVNITEKSGLLDFCFELEEVKDNPSIIIAESIYMAYPATSYDRPKFLTLGYVEKQTQQFINKNYVWSARNFIINIGNGQEECPPAGTMFKCTDIALINGHICAIMENDEYGKFIGDLSQIKGKIFCFHETKDYNRWIKLYGKSIASKILEGDIYIGMTKKMVLASWGNPDEINSINVGGKLKEQWIYPRSNRYLYFSGNKLAAIQDM